MRSGSARHSVLGNDVRYQQNRQTAGRIIDGLAFVVTPRDNRLHSLNETATRIWELSKHGCTAEEAADALYTEFAVTLEAAQADVRACLDDLVAREILLVEDEGEK